MADTLGDYPTVCVAHGAFVPCRRHGRHRYTDNPYWVKSVRDYHGSDDPDLTWEPAWPTERPERKPEPWAHPNCMIGKRNQ